MTAAFLACGLHCCVACFLITVDNEIWAMCDIYIIYKRKLDNLDVIPFLCNCSLSDLSIYQIFYYGIIRFYCCPADLNCSQLLKY